MEDRSSGDGSKRLDEDRFDDTPFGHTDGCDCIVCIPGNDAAGLMAEAKQLEQLVELQARVEHMQMRHGQLAAQCAEKARDLEGTARRCAKLSGDMTVLLAAIDLLDLECQYDKLNPCWAGRPSDVAGVHWAGGAACPKCTVRGAVAVTRGGV